MTYTLWRRSRGVTRALTSRDLPEVLELCDVDPVDSVLAAARFRELAARSLGHLESWGWPSSGPLEAVCWAGANLVPVIPSSLSPARARQALHAFTRQALLSPRRSSSLVGEQGAVMSMWRQLAGRWRAREVRENQPSMMMDTDSTVVQDTQVRTSSMEEFNSVFAACVAMFTEEVGYSPLAHGAGNSYALRVRELISLGRSYVHMVEDDRGHVEVAFKAEVGALTPKVAQIQGVWVAPRFRGRGLSVPGMAAVVERVRAQHAPTVSLYVNDFNVAAVRCYDRVGFTRVGSYSTILL